MSIRILYTLSFILLSYLSLGQEKKLTPLDHRLEPIENLDNAVYILEAQEGDSGLYQVTISYKDHQPLMEGTSKDIDGQVLDGNSVWYYKNGNVQSEGKYVDGKKSGSWKRYNEDGSQKSDRVYSDISMENYIFNSALISPKPLGEIESVEVFVMKMAFKQNEEEFLQLSPIKLQLVISKMGQVMEMRFDDRLSPQAMKAIEQSIQLIPGWKPGSTGTQNINVRTDYILDFATLP